MYPTYIHPHVTEGYFCRKNSTSEAAHNPKMSGLMDPRMGTMTGISSAKRVVKECQNALARYVFLICHIPVFPHTSHASGFIIKVKNVYE